MEMGRRCHRNEHGTGRSRGSGSGGANGCVSGDVGQRRDPPELPELIVWIALGAALALGGGDVLGGLTHGGDFFGLFVGNFDVEFLL